MIKFSEESMDPLDGTFERTNLHNNYIPGKRVNDKLIAKKLPRKIKIYQGIMIYQIKSQKL